MVDKRKNNDLKQIYSILDLPGSATWLSGTRKDLWWPPTKSPPQFAKGLLSQTWIGSTSSHPIYSAHNCLLMASATFREMWRAVALLHLVVFYSNFLKKQFWIVVS